MGGTFAQNMNGKNKTRRSKMGIRIDIKWNFISPALGCISGIVEVWQIDNTFTGNYYPNKLILKCNCKKDRHSIGFSSMNDSKGIPSKVFDLFNDTLKTMIDSYYKGLILDEHMFQWIEDSLIPESKSFKEWSKTKGYEEGA